MKGHAAQEPSRSRHRAPVAAHGHEGHAHHGQTVPQAGGELKDPVCGNDGDGSVASRVPSRRQAGLLLQRRLQGQVRGRPGQVPGCPFRLGRPGPGDGRAGAAGAIYTCPMHPEVRQDHPGACPKCGMALEPEMPEPRRGREPRAAGLPAALLVDPAADHHRHRAGDGSATACNGSTWPRRAGSSSC